MRNFDFKKINCIVFQLSYIFYINKGLLEFKNTVYITVARYLNTKSLHLPKIFQMSLITYAAFFRSILKETTSFFIY